MGSYIDDVITLLCPRGAGRREPASDSNLEAIGFIRAAHAEAGTQLRPDKAQTRSSHALVWGAEIDGV